MNLQIRTNEAGDIAMREQMIPLIASALVVVVQIIFAPLLTIFSVVPNFIVAFVVVLVVLRRTDSTYVYVFVLGLISDLLAETPVGLTPLLLLIISFVLSRIFEVLDDSNIIMPLITFAAALFAYETVFMIVLMCVGYEGGFIELFLQRALPATLFNAVIAALLFILLRRFPFVQQTNDAWRVSNSSRYR